MLTFIYIVKRRRPRFVGGAIEISLIDWLSCWIIDLIAHTEIINIQIVQFRNIQFWWQVLHSGVWSTVMLFSCHCLQIPDALFSAIAHARLSWHLLTECCKRKTCTHVVVCYPTLKCSELTDACVGFDLSHVAFVSQKHSSQNDK